MARLRWRAIARALGVPRSELALHARLLRSGHRRHGNWFTLGNRWTLDGLREWAEVLEPPCPVCHGETVVQLDGYCEQCNDYHYEPCPRCQPES